MKPELNRANGNPQELEACVLSVLLPTGVGAAQRLVKQNLPNPRYLKPISFRLHVELIRRSSNQQT